MVYHEPIPSHQEKISRLRWETGAMPKLIDGKLAKKTCTTVERIVDEKYSPLEASNDGDDL